MSAKFNIPDQGQFVWIYNYWLATDCLGLYEGRRQETVSRSPRMQPLDRKLEIQMYVLTLIRILLAHPQFFFACLIPHGKRVVSQAGSPLKVDLAH